MPLSTPRERRPLVPIRPRRPAGFDSWGDPLRDIDEALGRMGQLLEGTAGSRPQWPAWPWPASAWSGGVLVDVEETDDAYIIEIELPGVRADDLEVEVREDRLWIRGEVKDRERDGEVHDQSRDFGRFEHVLPLPPGADPDRIEATLADGVLTVRVPKPEAGSGHRIEVRQA